MRVPESAALEVGGRVFAAADVEARAARTAEALASRGLTAGDRLAIYLENRIEYIDLVLACVRLGVIVVPINILYREREIAHILADAEPAALVAAAPVPGGHAWWNVADLVAGTRAPGTRRSRRPHVSRGIHEPAAIIYTSGTTGAAKGAVLTRGNFAANARTIVRAWRLTSGDRLLLALPLFHVHGLGNGLCGWLASGCRLRLLPRFDAGTIVEEFRSFQPTVFFGVPTMYVRLLEVPAEVAADIGRTMRLCVSGSAPLPVQVFDAFRVAFGHAILERYGMTETLMTVSNPYAGERRPGTVGLPLPGVDVRLVRLGANGEGASDPGDAAEAGVGEEGELWIRGPNVFAGYWRRPDATRAAFVGDWFRTGDIGRRSADGYITLCGRIGDTIVSGGFNIYPREIEEVLLAHPGVREAAVVGVPDPVRGEVPVAYLVVDDDVRDEALREHLRRELASFKLPRAFVRVDALPRTALGKIQRHLLPPWTH